MKIMDILYAFNALHVVYKICHRDAFRASFQQDVGRFSQDTPGTEGDQYGNAYRKQWISQCPVSQEDDDASNNDAYGCTYIAKNMERCSTHIEIIALFLQTKTNIEVDDNADPGCEEHDQWLHRLRMLEALNCFPGNGQGNDDQCYSNDQ